MFAHVHCKPEKNRITCRIRHFGLALIRYIMPLTDLKIRSAKPGTKPLKLQDGHGLYLDVRPSGLKIWRYRYWITSEKDGVFTIGEYPGISLSDARKAREWAREQVKRGMNPTHIKDAEKLRRVGEGNDTFAAIAQEWLDSNQGRWVPTYRKQIAGALARNVYPKIGDLPIRMVTAAHILNIIRTVEAGGAPTVAAMLRQWSGQVFRYAVVTLRAESDPSSALSGAVKHRPVRHHPPLSKADIPDFVRRIDTSGGYLGTTIALKLMMLTFVRTVELRGAEWDEFDLDAAEWRIPAVRMKMRKQMKVGEVHIVPLSSQAVALLRELATLSGGRRFLFPNLRTPDTFLSGATINHAIARMGYAGKFSGHGFRSTASTLLHELGWRPEVIERQLAHAEQNKVKAAYNHAEYMTERRAMMQAWADWIAGLTNS